MFVFSVGGVAWLLVGSLYYAVQQQAGKANPFMALPMILAWPWFLITGGR